MTIQNLANSVYRISQNNLHPLAALTKKATIPVALLAIATYVTQNVAVMGSLLAFAATVSPALPVAIVIGSLALILLRHILLKYMASAVRQESEASVSYQKRLVQREVLRLGALLLTSPLDFACLGLGPLLSSVSIYSSLRLLNQKLWELGRPKSFKDLMLETAEQMQSHYAICKSEKLTHKDLAEDQEAAPLHFALAFFTGLKRESGGSLTILQREIGQTGKGADFVEEAGLSQEQEVYLGCVSAWQTLEKKGEAKGFESLFQLYIQKSLGASSSETISLENIWNSLSETQRPVISFEKTNSEDPTKMNPDELLKAIRKLAWHFYSKPSNNRWYEDKKVT